MKLAVQPDPQRAASLRRQATVHLDRVAVTDHTRFSDLCVIDYYDALHKLAEAVSLTDGVKFTGDGAHEELFAYVAKRLSLSGADALFLQELRKRRNAFHYEGESIGNVFLENHEHRLQALVTALRGS